MDLARVEANEVKRPRSCGGPWGEIGIGPFILDQLDIFLDLAQDRAPRARSDPTARRELRARADRPLVGDDMLGPVPEDPDPAENLDAVALHPAAARLADDGHEPAQEFGARVGVAAMRRQSDPA